MKATAILAVLLAASTALATTIPAPPAPQPGSAKLAAFVGSWSGSADIEVPGQQPMKTRVTIDCREASGGWGVRCNAAFLSADMNYLETDLFGYDAATGKVHWYSVTNAGEVHDHVGAFDGDSRLTARHQGMSDKGELTEDVTVGFQGKKAMQFDVTTMIAGKTTSIVHGKVSRQK